MLIGVIIATLVFLCIHGLSVIVRQFEDFCERMDRYEALMDELDEITEEKEEETR